MSSPRLSTIAAPKTRRIISLTLLAWIAYIGLDFLLNAGLLARVIDWQQPGLLSSRQMFLRIPLGYLSFLLSTVLMTWLMVRSAVRDTRSGFVFGVRFGLFIGAIGFLGQLSIFSFRPKELLLWSMEAALSCTLVGTIIGSGLERERLSKLGVAVVMLFLACIIIALILQNFGGGQHFHEQ